MSQLGITLSKAESKSLVRIILGGSKELAVAVMGGAATSRTKLSPSKFKVMHLFICVIVSC
jgi:hypothetical protein